MVCYIDPVSSLKRIVPQVPEQHDAPELGFSKAHNGRQGKTQKHVFIFILPTSFLIKISFDVGAKNFPY